MIWFQVDAKPGGFVSHKEADTLLIYHAIPASRCNPTDSGLVLFSLDTDVLILVIANYDTLLKDTYMSMVSESLQINPIWTTFGSDRHKALPAFHAFTGSNSSGRFARIGKVSWLNIYLKSDHSILSALPMLSQTSEVTKDQLSDLARFLCAAYLPKGVQIDNILKLR